MRPPHTPGNPHPPSSLPDRWTAPPCPHSDCPASAQEPRPAAPGPAGCRADLVILGAGGAGLVAAVSALENACRPLDILVLEKAAAPGGNTAQSAGLFAIDSPAQRRKGIVVAKEEIFKEKMAYAHWRIDPDLTLDCLDLCGWLVAWLERRGMYFDNVIEFLREGEAPKVFHSFSLGPGGFIGKTIVERLTEECARLGVRMLCGATATQLQTHEGRVTAVTVKTGDTESIVQVGAVVLATGGFGGNRVLLEKYFPGHGDVFTLNRPEITGDGLLLAEQVGAAIDDNFVLLVTGPHHYPWSHVLTLLVRRPEVVLVNKEGHRYSDETLFLDYHTEAGNALSRQPGKSCWALLDSAFKEHLITTGEIISGMEREAGGAGAWVKDLEAELEAGVARGTVAKADDWVELATAIGVDPPILAYTVDHYNTLCDQGVDLDFYKEPRFLRPLRTGPFYAVLGRQGFDTTLGGIKVDRRLRVLDRESAPIPGLYAAGDCASGWEHENYNLRHPGSALTFALCSGYIAGREAAAYVTNQGGQSAS